MNRNNKNISILLLLAIVIQIFTPFLNIVGYAKKDTVIDEVVLEEAGKKNGKPAYNLKAKWSIDDKSKKKGESFELKLPDDIEMEFLPGDLYLNSPNGKVYAEGIIEGNTIKFTFTDLVESDINIHGNFYINGLTTKKGDTQEGIVEKPTNITENGNTIWEGSIKVDTGTIVGESGVSYYSHNFRKNPQDGSYTIERKDGNIILIWNIDINTTEKDQYKGNIVIKDTVDGSQVIDIESFDLHYLEAYGVNDHFSGKDNIEAVNREDIIVNHLKVSEDGKSFELDIDVDGNYGYVLWYETIIPMEDYLKDLSLGMESYQNHISIEYDNEEIEASTGEYDFAKIGQLQVGDVSDGEKGKLNLIKLDKEKNKLEGSQFTIEKIDTQGNTLGYVSIDNDENVKFNEYENDKNKDPRPLEIPKEGLEIENFPSGAYKITEIEAPKGYKKLKEPIVKVIDFQTINFIKDKSIEYLKVNYYYIAQNINYTLGYAIGENQEKTEEIVKEFLKSQSYDFEKEAIVIEIENKENKKDLEIVKKWKNLEEYKGDKETLKAKFQLFAYKLVDGKPKALDEGELENIIGIKGEPKIYEVEYGKGSKVIKDLPYEDKYGNEYVYTIEELDLPDFDKEDDKVIKLSEYVDVDDVKVEFINTYNPKPKGSLKIKKVDSKDETKVLEGVKFTLKNNELGYEESLESDGEGLLEFKDLKPGKYTLKEVKSLDGYEKIDFEIKVIINEEGKTEIVKTENDLIEFKEDTLIVKNVKEKPVEDPKLGFKLKKVDSKDKTGLTGAVFELYEIIKEEVIVEKEVETELEDDLEIEELEEIENEDTIEDESEKVDEIKDEVEDTDEEEKEVIVEYKNEFVKKVITDNQGLVSLDDLEPGEYILKEIKAPEGYKLEEKEIKIVITKDDNGNYNYQIDEVDGVRFDSETETIEVDNVKTPTEPETPDPEKPTDPDTPKPEKPIKPNRPPKPEKPIKPVDPDKPEPEKPIKPVDPDKPEPEEPEEEVEEEIKDDIIIEEEPEEEVEEETKDDIILEEPKEEIVVEEIKDDIIIEEEKHLPKTGDGLNSRVYGLITLALGSLLLLLGVRSKEDEK